MIPRNNNRYSTVAHDDIQGILGTALNGAAQWTPAAYRTTGIVFNTITSGDYFTMIFQNSHKKKLSTNMDSIHIHYVPLASKNGNIAFTYAWGWYNDGDAIPDTLPNTGTVADIGLLTTDQYVSKMSLLITNLAFPSPEEYSSMLFVKITAAAPAGGTNWWSSGGTNNIALIYMDAHFITDRTGSLLEYTDS